jgi:hypothetical protein
MTISLLLGLGTGTSHMHSSNIIVSKMGSFSRGSMHLYSGQRWGSMFSSDSRTEEQVEIGALAHMLGFKSLQNAMEHFAHHYITPLYQLSRSLSNIFNFDLDIEFAIPPNKGSRLYLLQARQSSMRKALNEGYPENVKENRIAAMSRTVLGAVSVETRRIVDISDGQQYTVEAESGFETLKRIDAEGKPYILIVHPQATSTNHETLPISELRNLAFIVEKLVPTQVHQVGVMGVDHISRLLVECTIGYIEAQVNFEKLSANSKASVFGNAIVYEGQFGAAVCGATKRGMLYIQE